MFGLDMFGGVTKSLEKVAMELIETDKESAEAKAVMVKALDPNGAMRRDISNKVSWIYTIYIGLVTVLLLMSAFNIGDVDGTKLAITEVTDLFVPITAMFSAIVGASFGTNVANTIKGK